MNVLNKIVVQGADITKLSVDLVVNAAKWPDLLKESKTLSGCETRQSKKEVEKRLKSRYTGCLDSMKDHQLKKIAFCCISTGINGYPNDSAAKLAVKTVVEWMKCNPDVLEQVIFCSSEPKELYTDLMAESEFEDGEKEEVKEVETSVPEK